MMEKLLDIFAATPELITLVVALLGLIILLLAAAWPLDRSPKRDPMADAFGDWPNIDPRV